MSHHDLLSRERPLLIDPGEEDPRRYIGFRQEIAYPIDNHPKGRATIDVLQLNRDELVENRRTLLNLIKLLRDSQELLASFLRDREAEPEIQDQLDAIEAALERCREDSAEYAAMCHYALA